jgi:hypothetical protein
MEDNIEVDVRKVCVTVVSVLAGSLSLWSSEGERGGGVGTGRNFR